MRRETAQKLTQLTSDFYQQVSESFSATRSAPWEGWQRVLDSLDAPPRAVIDLACGNLRFERFLAEKIKPAVPLEAYAYDSCDALVNAASAIPGVTVHYAHLDLAQTLLTDDVLTSQLAAPPCDLAVCFGFLHHLPLPEQRARLVQALVRGTRPGGVVALTFWQLSNSERLLKKARATTAEAAERFSLADLAENDYLLGWQDRTDVVRYAHDFTEPELDALVTAAPDARELARFSADGATGNLNRYLLLQRLSS